MVLATLAFLIYLYVTVDCNFNPQNASQTWTFASPAKNKVKKNKKKKKKKSRSEWHTWHPWDNGNISEDVE